MTEPFSPFLDVPKLLESSQPRGRGGWFWYAMGTFLLVVLAGALLSRQGGSVARAVNILSGVVMFGIVVTMGFWTWLTVRKARQEHEHLESLEELIQLRRWPQSAAVLEHMLSQPMRTPGGRVQALLYLSSVLARYNRFGDAIVVQTHLLDNVVLDPSTDHALRLGRTMAMLREDHLVDADRAINELRRDVRNADAEQPAPAPALESAGLALVELYRDVKTGHPAEAVELFRKALPVLRQRLGHRSADAWALVARAHDLLDQEAEAQTAYQNATLLSDAAELMRRYPEVATLESKYRATEVPAAAA